LNWKFEMMLGVLTTYCANRSYKWGTIMLAIQLVHRMSGSSQDVREYVRFLALVAQTPLSLNLTSQAMYV